jgi:hypothetical protein
MEYRESGRILIGPISMDDNYTDYEFKFLWTFKDDIQKTLNQWRHQYYIRFVATHNDYLIIARKPK